MADPASTLFDVHLFAVVRLKVSGVPAPTMTDAIPAALERIPAPSLYGRFSSPDTEYAEEISHYLVDVVGDTEFAQSRFFDSAEDPLVQFVRELVAWHDGGRDTDRLSHLLAQARQFLDATI
jgi:hypothetical protein